MLTDVILHGHLGKKYGKQHNFDIANAAQAVAALCANFKTFCADFRNSDYIVRVGKTCLTAETLLMQIAAERQVHIIPVAQGSKRSGGIKTIAAIAILTVATAGAAAAVAPGVGLGAGFGTAAFSVGGFGVTYGSIASFGLTTLLAGVSSLLTPVPKANNGNRNPVDQRPSFLFNGATNRSAEGTPIPIVFGRFRVGSIVASAGITAEQLL